MKNRLTRLLVALAVALSLAGGVASCATIDAVRGGEITAPRDEALRAVAGGYETLAAARETVLLLYVGGLLDKPKAMQARDALGDVGKSLAQAEELVESGMAEQAIVVIAFAKQRAETILKEARE